MNLNKTRLFRFTRCVPAVIATSMLLALVGCQKEEPDHEKNEQNQTEQYPESQSKHLSFYLQREPVSMDPRKGGNRMSAVVLRELFEGLMRIDHQGNPIFATAKDIDISEDRCTYRFRLRPSIWSNGMPVTAHDFEYSWKSSISPQATTAFSFAFYCIKNARNARLGKVSVDEVGIKAENDHTLLVTLEYPAPYFAELTAHPIYSPVCKAVVEKNPSWCNEAGPDYICNGPFLLSEWQHRSALMVVKNPSYWDASSVSVQKVTFSLIENPQTALNMFERGSLDWVGDPCGTIPLEAISHLKTAKLLRSQPVAGVNLMMLNTKNPLLSSAKNRKALAMAINRQELVDHLLQSGEKPSCSILPPTLTLLERPAFKDNDIACAISLLEEGLEEFNLSKESLHTLNISHSIDPRDRMIAEAILYPSPRDLVTESGSHTNIKSYFK